MFLIVFRSNFPIRPQSPPQFSSDQCISVTDANNTSFNFTKGINICLGRNSAIQEGSGFTKYGLAKRSKLPEHTTLKDHHYKLMTPESGTEAASTGEQVCGVYVPPDPAVTEIVGSDNFQYDLICPVKTVVGADSVSTDPALDVTCTQSAEMLNSISLAAQMVGGAKIAGTDTLVLTAVDLSTTTLPGTIKVAEENKADMRKISANFGMSLTANSCEAVTGNPLLLAALQKGIGAAVSISGSYTELDPKGVSCTLSRRALAGEARTPEGSDRDSSSDPSDPAASLRRLGTATLEVPYQVYIPSTTANIDSVSESLVAKMTSGSDTAASFAKQASQAITSEISAASLDSVFTVQSVAVTGTPTVVKEESYDRRRTQLKTEEVVVAGTGAAPGKNAAHAVMIAVGAALLGWM